MINALTIPVDVEELRIWASGYKDHHQPPLSWKAFGAQVGIPDGTLQPWCKGNYQGDNERIARTIFKFRQTLHARNEQSAMVPVDPGYFETETSRRIQTLLKIAHMGRITIAATGPGTGKTMASEDYMAKAQPVWRATMEPTSKTVNSMCVAVQRCLGVEVKYLWAHGISTMIADRFRGRRGLLIIDEAQHLEWAAFEQIRAWHDSTGVGICFLGNEELLARIENGRQRDAFGRLNSRIAQRHVQRLPLAEDVIAFCDAWQLHDPGIRKYLNQIALTPGVGGLRECKMIVEAATYLAVSENRGLTLADLRDAQSERATRWIAA